MLNNRPFDPDGSYPDPFTGFFLPHKVITLGHDSVTDFMIPWEFNREMLRLDSTDQYSTGAFVLSVLSPLQVATGVTNYFDVRLRVTVDNIQFARYLTHL